MKTNRILVLLLCIAIIINLISCNKILKKESDTEKNTIVQNDVKYIEYISEYSTGMISSKSDIIIKLAKPIDLNDEKIADTNKNVNDKILKISPKIKGTMKWEDNRTIVFHPEKQLPSGENYNAVLAIDTLYNNVPDDKKEFNFSFSIIKQDFEVEIGDIIFSGSDNARTQTINGLVETADWMENQEIEKILEVNDAEDSKIEWDHSSGDNKHKFIITNLKRKEKNYSILLEFIGSEIGIKKKYQEKVKVYGLSDFNYLSYKLQNKPGDKYIKIQFSMPLSEKQDLSGVLKIDGDTSPKYLIEKNIIYIYPSNNHSNTLRIYVGKNLKDSVNNQLNETVEFSVTFKQEPPQVRWVRKNGGILPGNDNIIIPFEAVTLKAVDVTVIEIYEDNIIQFLQVNKQLNGNQEIKRVGRPIIYKTINLEETKVKNLYEWNRYNLDLSELVNLRPGSLYQVRINFRRSQSLYTCNTEEEIHDEMLKDSGWDSPVESSYWGYYDDYYYNDYNWSDRNDPCTDSYYGRRKQISVNILASNLGIIAKGSENGEVNVFVTDIITTDAAPGVDIEIYNYQKQLLGTGKTDSKGSCKIKVDQVPFAVVAKKGKERGYLRIDDGNSLSMSNFDVGGTNAKKGIKGFIYGDRGVWRPGDTIYLNFILEDKQNMLPEYHPVIFELKNPRGKVEKRIVKKDHVGGIYNFTIKTEPDAPTGNWYAYVRAGGELFSKKIKIETIRPNRLKINLDFNRDKLSVQDQNLTGNIEVKWLHGAIAKNLKAEFDVKLLKSRTAFDGYPEFSFNDPSRDFYSDTTNIFSGRLDETGKASFNLDIAAHESPGSLLAVFTGKVFEEGGNFSIDKLVMPYYPYTGFVGVKLPPGDKARGMLLTDEDHEVQIVSVDSYGKPVSRNNLEVAVYKLSWKWWWDNSESNVSNYMGRSYKNKITSGTVNTSNGKGTFTLNIKYPQWGRFFIRVYDPVTGHAAGKVFYIDWPGWAGSSQRGELGGASMLSFYSDDQEYKVGDNAKITIPASSNGNCLISVESGSRVIDHFWVKTKEGKTEFNLKITKEMSPNVYIFATLIQPHGQVENDLPIRLYGAIPIKVVDPETKLEPVVSVADTLAPEKDVTIKIKEKNGRPMSFTVAVVDEGLLDLTNFRTPDPWSTFFSKEALGVKSWDIYDDVIGALAKSFGPLLSIGGGGELESPKQQQANRFKPVVKFFGPYYLEKSGEKVINFKMPRYVGAVKTMVVAAHEGSYGNTEKSSFVKESIMVLGTMPRVLGPGEKLKLPVNVFVLDEKIKNVNVSVNTEGPLELDGESSKQVSFNKPGDDFVYFDLKTAERLGIGKVFITAVSGNEKATYEIELDVRPSNPVETEVYQGVIKPGQNWEQDITPFGLEGTQKAFLELSYLPPLNLEKRLNYLIRFPHGCIEQTTSSVFPQLYLDNLVDLSSTQSKEIQNNIEAGIARLKTFRTDSGGFSYWPGDNAPTEWGTNYAGHFLIEAKNKGYNIPWGLLSDWENYQKREANKWEYSSKYDSRDLIQAYRLYTLALYGKPAVSAMNRLKEKKELNFPAKWRLAAAYALIGKENVAYELISKLSTEVKEYKATSYTYGSSLRDKAMILETLALLDKKDMGFQVLKEIAEQLGTNNWYSTQTTAYSLIAIAMYKGKDSKDDSLTCSYAYGSDKGSLNSNKSYISKELNLQNQKISVKNNGKQQVYVRFIAQGIPKIGHEKEDENILTMEVKYKMPDGSIINNLSSLKQGTDFIIETKILNNGIMGDLEELALTQIFPSGWEILNARLQEVEDYSGYSRPEYQDIRDDRVLTYFDLKKGETKIFKIMLNASYQGEYYMPGINVEAMYNNTAFSRKKGRIIEVIR